MWTVDEGSSHAKRASPSVKRLRWGVYIDDAGKREFGGRSEVGARDKK